MDRKLKERMDNLKAENEALKKENKFLRVRGMFFLKKYFKLKRELK